jgi:hypothetical protein
MDRKATGRRVGNRNRTTGANAVARRRTRRRVGLASRRNRRQGIRRTRNRLARAQNNLRTNRRGPQRRFRRFNNFNRRRNLRLRIVFVGGLPTDVDNRRLYSLFRKEGRIVGCRMIFNRMGISKGYGFIEFGNPRDAWRTIRKWNNTTLGGRVLTVEYRRRRRTNRRRFAGNNFGNGFNNRSGFNSYNNYGRYNPPRQGFGFRGRRGGFRGGFRPRGGY